MTKDGKPVFAFGVMGGAMQPQGGAPRVRHFGSSQPTGEVMTDGNRANDVLIGGSESRKDGCAIWS